MAFRWLPVDPVLARAGLDGERQLARVRLLLFAALTLIPLSWLLPHATDGVDPADVRAGVAICAVALAIAAAIDCAARRGRLPAWFPAASGVLDVSLVSLALATFLAIGRPFVAVNSAIIFDLYFLGLSASALRYDWRVCALAAAAAVTEYAGIGAYAARHFDLSDAAAGPAGYGVFRWATQVGRCVLLALGGALAATFVVRATRLRAASLRDRLTDLANRRYFDERLAEEWARARQRGGTLAAIVLDIDHFKHVNDRYGHAAGDVVLREVGAVLRAHARETDVLARYGGEEFALLLVGAGAGAALARAEALRAAVEELTVTLPGTGPGTGAVGGPDVQLTISLGVAHADEADLPNQAAFIRRADKRLYEAKARGRNRVVGVLESGWGWDVRPSATTGPTT